VKKIAACASALALVMAGAAHADTVAGAPAADTAATTGVSAAAAATQNLDPNAGLQQTKPAAAALKPASIPQLQGLADFAHRLYSEDGVLIRGVLNNDFQGNTGGLRQGVDNGGGYSFGLDWDTRKLLGTGGQVYVLFTQFYGKTTQHNIGNAIKTEGWYYPVEHFNLSQFAYSQDFFNDKLNFYGGRMNATAPFARPTYGCQFISGSQCPYFLPLQTGGFTSFPYVTWGGRLKYNPTPEIYAQVGAFEIDPRRRTEEGFNWSLNGATGYVLPVELGYSTSDRHYKIGGWYNSAPYTDPVLNTLGLSRILHGGKAMSYDGGRGGVYALGDQVIYRPNDGSQRNLAVFASTSMPIDDEEIFQSQSTAGFYWTGPMAARPYDTMGVMMTYIVFTGRETELMDEELEKAKSASLINRDEVMLELNYGYRLARGVIVLPNFQYIVNPDISQRPTARVAPKDAAVLGVRLSINLGEILGLPSVIPMARALGYHGEQ
jgi:porin